MVGEMRGEGRAAPVSVLEAVLLADPLLESADCVHRFERTPLPQRGGNTINPQVEIEFVLARARAHHPPWNITDEARVAEQRVDAKRII
jgi:hypothetical protein